MNERFENNNIENKFVQPELEKGSDQEKLKTLLELAQKGIATPDQQKELSFLIKRIYEKN